MCIWGTANLAPSTCPSQTDLCLALLQGQWAVVPVAAESGKDLVLIHTWQALR
jgi:hypothetical protein